MKCGPSVSVELQKCRVQATELECYIHVMGFSSVFTVDETFDIALGVVQ